MVAGSLTVGSDGRISGPISISYNTPFPCPNGRFGSGAIQGVVMHTMVGNLPGTIAEFNNPRAEVSAHFGIDQDGHVHQFGPIGKGWIAFAEAGGNDTWYSIEHADDGNQETPLTSLQVTASAQLLEVLSRFAGFPLQVTDSVSGRGYGTHVMGGAAWGGHTCPGPGPRAGQRAEIVAQARLIRAGTAKPKPVSGEISWKLDGDHTLAQVAENHTTEPATILRRTAVHDGVYSAALAKYINEVFAASTVKAPAGVTVRLPH